MGAAVTQVSPAGPAGAAGDWCSREAVVGSGLSRSGWRGNAEILADLPRQSEGDLAVTGDRG